MASVAGCLPCTHQSKYHTVGFFPSRTFCFKCQEYLIHEEMLEKKKAVHLLPEAMYFTCLLSKVIFKWTVPCNPETQPPCIDPSVISTKQMKCNSEGEHLTESMFTMLGSTIPLENLEGSVHGEKVENQCFRKSQCCVSTADGGASLKQSEWGAEPNSLHLSEGILCNTSERMH